MGDYQVETAELEGQRFNGNNRWEFETSITNAGTSVLIVESDSRREFRYLSILFSGRDKSLQLQYVRLHPDEVEGQNESAAATAQAMKKAPQTASGGAGSLRCASSNTSREAGRI